MTQHNHQTAPTQFVEANAIRFAYRRFGKTGGVPLVFNQHFRGTMDYWDPAVTDGLAKNREVMLFDSAGVSSSSGRAPTSMQQNLPNAQLILYPDANHGSFFQYPELFVSEADQFLTSAQQDDDTNLQPSERLPFPYIISAEEI